MSLKFSKSIIVMIGIALSTIFLSEAQAQNNAAEMKKADSLYIAKDYVSARKLYERNLKDTSKNGVAWNRLGFSYYNTGNMDAAARSYEKALSYSHIPQ